MKKKTHLKIIFTLFISNFLTAQHTEKFKKLISNLKLIDTIKINKKYKNGNQKEIGNYSVYELNDFEYEQLSGKHITYYSNGQILEETTYDNFGIVLKWKLYDGLGNLQQELKTIKIDTDKESLDELLNDNNSIDIIIEEKKYKFSDKICGWFLIKEGQKINGKKIGKWKKYYPNGEVKKVKEYKALYNKT